MGRTPKSKTKGRLLVLSMRVYDLFSKLLESGSVQTFDNRSSVERNKLKQLGHHREHKQISKAMRIFGSAPALKLLQNGGMFGSSFESP